MSRQPLPENIPDVASNPLAVMDSAEGSGKGGSGHETEVVAIAPVRRDEPIVTRKVHSASSKYSFQD